MPKSWLAGEYPALLACVQGTDGHGVTVARTYYAVSAAVKWEYGLCYLALTAFLAVMAFDVHEMLERRMPR